MRVSMCGLGTLASLLLVATAWPAAAQPSPVMYACVGPEGQLRVVSDVAGCRPSEAPIAWNQQGPEGPEGPQGDPGAPAEGGGGPTIIDANDVVVGPFVTTGQGADGVLVKPDADNQVILSIFARSIQKPTPPFSPGFLLWTSSDCTGPAYFAVARGLTQPLVNRNFFFFDGDELVYADLAAEPQMITAYYMAPIFPFVGDVGCAAAGALSATPSKRWTPPYVPPFRIE